MLERYQRQRPGDRVIYPQHTSMVSRTGIVVNIINFLIGTGVMKLGYRFRCGVIIGPLMALVFSLLGVYISYLNIQAHAAKGAANFLDIWENTFGRKTKFVVSFINVIFMIIVGEVYIGFIIDSLGSIINMFVTVKEIKIVGLIVVGLIGFPLSFMRNLKWMEVVSYIAIGCILFLAAHTVYWFIYYTKKYGFDRYHQIRYWSFGSSTVSCMGSLTTAFLYQPLTFPGFNNVRKASLNSLMRDIIAVHVATLLIYLVFGVLGYLTFFDANDDGLILDYYEQTPFVTCARIALLLLMICSFPIPLNSVRYAAIDFIGSIGLCPYNIWVIVGFCVCIASFMLTSLTGAYANALGIACDAIAPVMLFIFPSVFYLKVFKFKNLVNAIACIFFIVIGLCASSLLISFYF